MKKTTLKCSTALWFSCGTAALRLLPNYIMSRLMIKQTKWHVRPVKTQISLGIRPVWSESLLLTLWKLGSLACHWAHSVDSDQTVRMPRLIWVFAGRTVILLVLLWGGSYVFAQVARYAGPNSCHHWLSATDLFSWSVFPGSGRQDLAGHSLESQTSPVPCRNTIIKSELLMLYINVS